MADLAHKIRDYFADKPEIASVYLFGSQASGKERPKSDVDIGILLCSDYMGSAQKLREKYLVDLGRILRKDIHPVIMNQSGELLLKQIFSKGKAVLLKQPKTDKEFRMTALSMIADFNSFYLQKMRAGFTKRILETEK